MCCADERKAGEMPGGTMPVGASESQMSAAAAMAHQETSTGLTDFELAEYLREREGQTVAMAPGQHGQMPGGEMRGGPQETQVGTMAVSQQGEMPGGEMRAGPHG